MGPYYIIDLDTDEVLAFVGADLRDKLIAKYTAEGRSVHWMG